MPSLHSVTVRAMLTALGAVLIFGSIFRHPALAFVMALIGGALIVTSIADVCVFELLFKWMGGDVNPQGGRHVRT